MAQSRVVNLTGHSLRSQRALSAGLLSGPPGIAVILYSMLESIAQLDTFIFFFINTEFQNRFFDVIMPFITHRSYFILIPFLLILLVREPRKTLTVFTVAFCSFLLADAIGNGLKNVAQRIRPCHVYEGINLLVGCGGSFSLPSNHAANSVAFAVPFLVLTQNPIRHGFVAVAGLVCFSRVYVGVHYPADVAAGAALGAAVAGALIGLYRWAERNFAARPAFTVMGVFLLGISIFRIYYILDGPLDLSPDEAHYWEWSRRPDLSYYSKGPAIAYLIALGTAVFGDTVFGVRILAVFLSLMSGILLYRLGREVYDEATGAAAAILLQIVPLFSA
ncbi:MAG: phosphatase PAP2 family protein, partial [Candidatus Dadabacteria bacterium]